jgi:hypothetical protein
MLSTSDVWAELDGTFDYNEYFENVVDLFSDPEQVWAIETLGWWQK